MNIDPLVNLDIDGYLISQVVLNFVSQTNIMTRETWERLGQLRLLESGVYIKLSKKGLIEPSSAWKYVNTRIMGIKAQVNFERIEPQDGETSFPALVCHPLGRKMKASSLLEKDRINLYGDGKKLIVPIYPLK